MSIQKATLYSWAFGHLKQLDILTPIAAASLNKCLPYKNFSAARMEKVWNSDRPYFGKGHEFATDVRKMSEHLTFAREFDATAESLAWALSLLMGDISTGAPVGGVYPHTLVWVAPTVQKETLYTSIIEKAGSEYQKLLSGVTISDIALTATGSEHLALAVNCTARKQIDNATSLPAVTPSVYFRSTNATFTFGAEGSQTSVSEQVLGWALSLSQNPEYRWMAGQTSGDEQLYRYALIGTQAISGHIKCFIDNTRRNLYLNDTRVGLTITCTSVQDVNQTLVIEIPSLVIQAEEIAQDGQTTSLQFNFTEDTVRKDANVAGSPIKITLKNTLSALAV